MFGGGSASVRFIFKAPSHKLIFLFKSKSPIPPTYLEQKRAEAQALYREEQAYIAANKDNFERLLEEDRQAMAREMSGNAFGVVQSMFLGKKPEAVEPGTAATSEKKT